MERPRDTRFYEIPLPGEIFKSQKWLISYHENCRRLVEYMEHEGAGQTAYYSTIQCLQRLRSYLLIMVCVTHTRNQSDGWIIRSLIQKASK
ncbi:hypothetical protein [Butyrivibrio sp.]|jgi:hypothetical protein|uniref:hypothetical protein n=1 Tax=Butyrivibrio sp. TaxID=28121 RepID=UPI0025BBEADA|nr:hypothetical protein [Butyrivibrio sp.]MBE5838019.1 hypothetical protein [Butyrivibrio sp.]